MTDDKSYPYKRETRRRTRNATYTVETFDVHPVPLLDDTVDVAVSSLVLSHQDLHLRTERDRGRLTANSIPVLQGPTVCFINAYLIVMATIILVTMESIILPGGGGIS